MSEFLAENEIVNPIKITNNAGESYELDFSRESVVFAQERGFDIDAISQKPNIVIPELWYYAFRKNHRDVAKNQAEKIRYRFFPNGIPSAVLGRLRELYLQASLINLIDVEEDGNEKNSNVTVEM